MTKRTSLNFWIDFASLLVMLALIVTGGIIHWIMPPRTARFLTLFGWDRHDIGQLHFILGMVAVVLLIAHVALHFSWMCCVAAKAIGHDPPTKPMQIAFGVGLVVLTTSLVGAMGFVTSSSLERGSATHKSWGKRPRLHTNAPRAVSGSSSTTSDTLPWREPPAAKAETPKICIPEASTAPRRSQKQKNG